MNMGHDLKSMLEGRAIEGTVVFVPTFQPLVVVVLVFLAALSGCGDARTVEKPKPWQEVVPAMPDGKPLPFETVSKGSGKVAQPGDVAFLDIQMVGPMPKSGIPAEPEDPRLVRPKLAVMLWLAKAPETDFPFWSGGDDLRAALVGLNEVSTIAFGIVEPGRRVPLRALCNETFKVMAGDCITLGFQYGFEYRHSLKVNRVCSAKMFIRTGTVVDYGLIIDSAEGINIRRERSAAWAALEVDCEVEKSRYEYGPMPL